MYLGLGRQVLEFAVLGLPLCLSQGRGVAMPGRAEISSRLLAHHASRLTCFGGLGFEA